MLKVKSPRTPACHSTPGKSIPPPLGAENRHPSARNAVPPAENSTPGDSQGKSKGGSKGASRLSHSTVLERIKHTVPPEANATPGGSQGEVQGRQKGGAQGEAYIDG